MLANLLYVYDLNEEKTNRDQLKEWRDIISTSVLAR